MWRARRRGRNAKRQSNRQEKKSKSLQSLDHGSNRRENAVNGSASGASAPVNMVCGKIVTTPE
jgi:hypothetical protein